MAGREPAWKKYERWVGYELGGKRRGADYRGESGGKNDLLVPGLSGECKLLKAPSVADIRDAWKQALEARGLEDEIPVAFVAKKGSPYEHSLAVLSLWDLQRMLLATEDLARDERDLILVHIRMTDFPRLWDATYLNPRNAV